MAIVIYTYSNPYKINKEEYWAMIKNSFHLCGAQTLASGICAQYSELYKGKVTTVKKFINNLYENWDSDVTVINQRAAVDNVIEYLDFSSIITNTLDTDKLRLSLKRNRKYLLDSIRIMTELNIKPEDVKHEKLTTNQKCALLIYKELLEKNNQFFNLRNNFSIDEIDSAIKKTIEQDLLRENSNKEINTDIVVFHGIHQLSPIILRTIECLSKYKTVIILFNYQPNYKNVYQTWINIYSLFESKINISPNNFCNETHSIEGRKLADNMSAIIEGKGNQIDLESFIEVTEFDNETEFAGHISQKFEQAKKRMIEDNYEHTALYYMDEQIYSANSSVNNILRIYFPEQFGEYDFLDYPLGHFFVSITNMWNPELKTMKINDLDDIIECLSCGIIQEKVIGQNVTTFNKCKLYFENEISLKRIIKKLKKIKNRLEDIPSSVNKDKLERLEYYNVSIDEIDALINALKELNAIALTFFEDFNDEKNDFKKFYKKIENVLINNILEKEDINDEFRDIVERVLIRLNDVKDIDANASFDCLRETMELYLQQMPKEGRSANWIVRNFEQIDGDVLRVKPDKQDEVFHYACLSDNDMSITHIDEFPWPLDNNFFVNAQAPVDWKYQVYVTSRKEYKNFRRYALIFGLSFCKSKIKLSYIKNERDKENDMYYLLRILNANITPFSKIIMDMPRKYSTDIQIKKDIDNTFEFSQFDFKKFKICRYKFLLESIIEGKTIHKEKFLLKKYLIVLLENRIREKYAGKRYARTIVQSYLKDYIDEIESDFPFVNESDKIDVFKTVINYIENNVLINGKFPVLKTNFNIYKIIKEILLSIPSTRDKEKRSDFLRSIKQSEIDELLNMESLAEYQYKANYNELCENCSNKNICLEIFKFRKQEDK